MLKVFRRPDVALRYELLLCDLSHAGFLPSSKHFFILFTSSTIDKFQYNIVTHILGANTPKMGAVLSQHIGNVEIVTTTDIDSDQIEQF